MLRVDVICSYIFPEHQLPDSNDADNAGSRSEIAILLWQGNGQSYYQVNFKIEPTLPLHLGKVGVNKKKMLLQNFRIISRYLYNPGIQITYDKSNNFFILKFFG